jgi:hypothetical protein
MFSLTPPSQSLKLTVAVGSLAVMLVGSLAVMLVGSLAVMLVGSLAVMLVSFSNFTVLPGLSRPYLVFVLI